MIKKKGLLTTAIIILSLAIFSIFIFVMSRLDTENYYFKNYDDAVREGFAKDNWPKQVSTNATEIYAQSQYDIYEVWMRFEIDKESASKMVSSLKRLTDQEILEFTVQPPSYVDWWFDGFIQNSDQSTNAIKSDVYVDINGCETSHTSKNAYIVLERNSMVGYYGCT